MPNINGLPPEILGLIFMSYYQDLKPGGIDKGLAALCLTCKRWNDLAVSTPELWSFIEIIRQPSGLAISYSKVSTWLDRSRNCPLSLVVRAERLNPFQSPSIKALLPSLLAQSYRWCSVSLGFGDWFQPTDVHLPHTFTTPILESVEVICDGNKEVDHDVLYERLLDGCPALRSYTSNQRGHYQTDLPPNYSFWEQLKNFEVVEPTNTANALILLGRAINLHSCYLTIGPDHYGKPQSPQPVTSPIKKLTINTHTASGSRENVQQFFHFLDAPNLTDLSIIFMLGRHGMTIATLYDILSRPRLRLSSLTLRNLELSNDNFIDCLTYLSESITTFRVLRMPEGPVYGGIKNGTIDLLTFQGEGNPKALCPLLETLTLELCVRADDGLLARMVRSRRRSPRTLRDNGIALFKRLDVVFYWPQWHTSDEEELKEMYGEGLRGGVKFFIE